MRKSATFVSDPWPGTIGPGVFPRPNEWRQSSPHSSASPTVALTIAGAADEKLAV